MKKDIYFGHAGMSKIARILRYLKDRGEATNRELNRISFRYGAHIHELRKEGWKIKTHQLSNDGLYKFTFHGHKDEEDR
jgi:hypothetical protein